MAWSGVGIDLATNEPTREALREAVRTVLDQPQYRQRALRMADEFAAIDTRSAILGVISELVAGRQPAHAGRPAADKPRRAGQRG